jgi:hypothetical protein
MAKIILFSRLARWSPLTVPGGITLCASLVMTGLGFAAGNPFNFFLGIFFFVAIFIFVLLNRFLSRRIQLHLLTWNTPVVHLAGGVKTVHSINAERFKCPYFFRVHFLFQGHLDCGPGHSLFFRQEKTIADRHITPLVLRLPATGKLTTHGRYLFKDVFNLSRTVLSEDEYREFPVLPVIPDSSITESPVLSSADTQQKTSRKDNIEKYVMREYIPGDRLRDINWKASSRLNEWFTRISVEEDDVSRSIHILLHHCVPSHYRGIKAYLVHDYLKGLLSSLIMTDSKTVFHIHAGGIDTDVSNQEEAAAFLKVLAQIPPQDEAFPLPALEGRKTILIFSSTLDHNLDKTLSALADHKAFVYLAGPVAKNAEVRSDVFGDLPPQFVPGPWAFRSSRHCNLKNHTQAVIWSKKIRTAWLSDTRPSEAVK